MEQTAPRAFSTAEALRSGWEQLKSHLNPLVFFGLISAFLALLGSALQSAGRVGTPLAFALQLGHALLLLALIRVGLKLHEGEPVDFVKPTKWLRGYGNYLVTVFLYAVIVMVGTALLIVPGVIWALQFGLAPVLAAERGTDPLEALKESSRLTQGRKSQLFFFALAALGINLLGLMALGVGAAFTMPLTVMAALFVYRRLLARGPEPEVHADHTLPTPRMA